MEPKRHIVRLGTVFIAGSLFGVPGCGTDPSPPATDAGPGSSGGVIGSGGAGGSSEASAAGTRGGDGAAGGFDTDGAVTDARMDSSVPEDAAGAGAPSVTVLDPGVPRILVTTFGESGHGSGLVAVAESTGDRRMFSSYTGEAGTGTPFRAPHALVLDRSNRRALVTDGLTGLVAVDLASGNRTLISGTHPDSGLRGEGTPNFDPATIDLDATASVAYVVDWEHDALLVVDLVSGDRAIVAR